MSDTQRKEIDAFLHFFATFELSTPIETVGDLSDGAALFDVLSIVDDKYFPQTTNRPPPSENWVLRFGALKRLYRLMSQYFSDVLQKPTTSLEVPNLQALAKDYNIAAALIMCRLTIVIGVQCERNKEFIEKIQGLSEADQHYLMKAIEQVMQRINASAQEHDIGESTEDDHYYRVQSEKSQILSEKETVEKVYAALMEEHRTLQTSYDDAVSERDDALAQLRSAVKEADGGRRNDKNDLGMRAEIDRLRTELQKSEDNLALAESELEKHTHVVAELTRKIEELQPKVDEVDRLKDQIDEYRHAADKLQKTENVMEKYKKKLQEGADLRQHVKSLEKQNADLVDQNASLEEEYRKVAGYKPLIESYKNQISDLESKGSLRIQEMDRLRFELDQTKTRLNIVQDQRAKDSETLELYQERVKELELSTTGRPQPAKVVREDSQGQSVSGGESLEVSIRSGSHGEEHEEEEEEDEAANQTQALDGELDDAILGTTMTDLKLQIRKLKRELESVKKNEVDGSRVLVLENLLDDANRMKARYEADYLAAQREKLVLQRGLEEIRSGKSLGDGAEAAIALRQRLNETVDQYEALRKEHAELEVQFETQGRELTIAKSDLTLVNKDQLDILATLRDSVNEDKVGLEADLERTRKQAKELSDKNRMQLEQINGLLLEKVSLQSEGISQREKMLLRERDFGDLRSTLSGKDLPEDIKTRLLALHEDNIVLKEANKTYQEKLQKARQFIKNQDKLFKEEQARTGFAPSGTFDEAETSYRSQIKILEDDLERQKRQNITQTQQYRKEQEVLMGLIHNIGMNTIRGHLNSPASQSAWLGKQRIQRSPMLQR